MLAEVPVTDSDGNGTILVGVMPPGNDREAICVGAMEGGIRDPCRGPKTATASPGSIAWDGRGCGQDRAVASRSVDQGRLS